MSPLVFVNFVTRHRFSNSCAPLRGALSTKLVLRNVGSRDGGRGQRVSLSVQNRVSPYCLKRSRGLLVLLIRVLYLNDWRRHISSMAVNCAVRIRLSCYLMESTPGREVRRELHCTSEFISDEVISQLNRSPKVRQQERLPLFPH